jgi:probable rRNA maturation factor
LKRWVRLQKKPFVAVVNMKVFDSIKDTILGKKYELSVAYLSPTQQKKLNKKYRNIDKTTNVLSFSYSKTSGELTFDLVKVKKDAPLFEMSYSKFLQYLFIHGCLHLKGYEHSATMEKEEQKFLKKFSSWQHTNIPAV